MSAPSFEWLKRAARNTYSQWGEDGVVDAIFAAIGTENRWCFECGAHDGVFFSNTRRLIRDGWNALLVEADPEKFRRLSGTVGGFGERVKTICGRASQLDPLLHAAGAPFDLDLACIDVDGQDYHLFNSLLRYRPRVVILEYDPNADPDFIPEIDGEGQAGIEAIRRLAWGRLYADVYRSWCNLILVRQPLDRLLLQAAP